MNRLIANRFDVYLVQLDPSVGAEMRKTRPCVVISSRRMHEHLWTVVIAPMTSTRTGFPTRVKSKFGGKSGEIALDQMRALDIKRFGKRLGRIDPDTEAALRLALTEFFA